MAIQFHGTFHGLKISVNNYAFCWKIQQRGLRPGESAAGVMYLYNTPKKVPKVVATLLSVSWKGAVKA